MLSTPHLLVGAAVSRLLPHPALALVGGFISHFVLDSIPHWDPGTKLSPVNQPDGKHKEPSTLDWTFGAVELVAGVVLVGVIIRYLYHPSSIFHPLYWGALGGVLPDLIDNVPFWKSWLRKRPGFKQLHEFHHAQHTDLLMSKRYIGVLTQLGVSLVALFVIWAK